MKIQTAAPMTKKEQTTLLTSDLSKSQKMIALFTAGHDIKSIATLMDVRYNFVYNVISNEVRKSDISVDKEERVSKKSEVLTLAAQGKRVVDIASELKMNYNQVWKYINEAK